MHLVTVTPRTVPPPILADELPPDTRLSITDVIDRAVEVYGLSAVIRAVRIVAAINQVPL